MTAGSELWNIFLTSWNMTKKRVYMRKKFSFPSSQYSHTYKLYLSPPSRKSVFKMNIITIEWETRDTRRMRPEQSRIFPANTMYLPSLQFISIWSRTRSPFSVLIVGNYMPSRGFFWCSGLERDSSWKLPRWRHVLCKAKSDHFETEYKKNLLTFKVSDFTDILKIIYIRFFCPAYCVLSF